MIHSTKLGEELIKILQNAETIGENSVLDYKVEPYPKDRDCELFKDVLAMANSYDRPKEDRWIIFGVENRTHKLIGVDASHPDLLDDSAYQQKLQKIAPHLTVELVEIPAERVLNTVTDNKMFVAFYIPSSNVGEVYELSSPVRNKAPNSKGEFIKYEEGTSFIRVGSSTSPLREEHRKRIRSLKNTLMTFRSADYSNYVSRTLTSNVVDSLLLLGSWSEGNEEDRRMIARLCGVPYREATEELHVSLDYGLFRLAGSTWTIRDRVEALSSIGTHLTESSLQGLAVSLGEIITSIDEQYTLPRGQRLTADAQNVFRGCSKDARRGAASCCACLSNHRELVPNCTDREVDSFVSTVLSAVFDSEDWRKIVSADEVLPLLAEASPSIYLNYVERASKRSRAIRDYLSAPLTGLSSTHMGWGLINGIEICARQKDLLSKAMALLVRISPYTSFAKNAMVTILLPWLPQTNASIESRIGMGRYLMKRDESQAWEALRELLPGKTTSTIGAAKTTFLNTPDFSKPVTKEEFWRVGKEYCRCALEGMRDKPNRMADVASDIMSFVATDMISEFSEALRKSSNNIEDKDRYPAWREILIFLNRCNRISDAVWKPCKEILNELASLRDSIAPHDPYYLALLAHSLNDFDLATLEGSYDDMHNNAFSQRLASLERAFSMHGFPSIENLISDGCRGEFLGETLAQLPLTSEEEGRVFDMFDESSAESLSTARAYVRFSFRKDKNWFKSLAFDSLPQTTIAQILAALPFSQTSWKRVENLSSSYAFELYWKQVEIFSFSDEEEASLCTKHLLQVRRTGTVLETLSHSLKRGVTIGPSVIMDALEHLAERDFSTMNSYYAQGLLKHLEKASPGSRLCALEFKLSELLHDRPDAYIFTRMSKDPSLFAQITSLAYSPKDTFENGSDPSRNNISIKTLISFLPLWKITPGVSDDGAFNPQSFDGWITEARSLAKEHDCLDGADVQIGRNLFYAPVGTDSLFLPDAIAEFLDGNEMARRGYEMESVNSRGAHWVDPTGKSEDAIADSYESKARQAEERGYANLAALLGDISNTYRREAEENRREAMCD